MESVRKRTHDHANRIMMQQQDIIVLQQGLRSAERRIEQIEDLAPTVQALRTQAVILRWMLGIATAVSVAVLSRMFV